MRKHCMNHTKPQRQAGRISRPQLIAIIAIVLIGLGASAWLLKSAPSAPAGEAAEEGPEAMQRIVGSCSFRKRPTPPMVPPVPAPATR